MKKSILICGAICLSLAAGCGPEITSEHHYHEDTTHAEPATPDSMSSPSTPAAPQQPTVEEHRSEPTIVVQ